MPSFSFSPEIAGRESNASPMHPRHALQSAGPVVPVTVARKGLSLEDARQEDPPGFFSGTALIDTGAAVTCVNDAAIRELGIEAIDMTTIDSATQRNVPVSVFPVRLGLPGIEIDIPRAHGCGMDELGFLVIIGRDVLSQCILIYNGPKGEITLAI